MKRVVLAAGARAICAGVAVADGIERTSHSVGVLLESGNYGELSFGSVMPRVSGVGAGTTPPPISWASVGG